MLTLSGCANTFNDIVIINKAQKVPLSALCPRYANYVVRIKEAARHVQCIGFGSNSSPETILQAQQEAAERLFEIAAHMEAE